MIRDASGDGRRARVVSLPRPGRDIELPAPIRAGARATSRRRAVMFFDLASPYTYLAAERADRAFTGLRWVPVFAAALHCGPAIADRQERSAITARAQALGLPLILPGEGPPVRLVAAMRVAALAVEQGYGAGFVLAASRLLFCGGFDIDEPDVLLEAADYAGISRRAASVAAADARRDAQIAAAGVELVRGGATALPAIAVGMRIFCGERRLPEAVAAHARA